MLPIWKNLRFFLYLALYFNLTDSVSRWPTASLSTVVFRCLPIFHILVTVVSTISEWEHKKTKVNKQYQWKIVTGLILSLLGDISLVYNSEHLVLGLALFCLAHLVYISAFGFFPLGNAPTALTYVILISFCYSFLHFDLHSKELLIRAGVGVFMVLVFTMAWRATVRFQRERSVARAMAVIGSLALAGSEFMLCLETWHGKFVYSPMWVMLAYYLGQLCVGLSACDDQDMEAEPRGVGKGVKNNGQAEELKLD